MKEWPKLLVRPSGEGLVRVTVLNRATWESIFPFFGSPTIFILFLPPKCLLQYSREI